MSLDKGLRPETSSQKTRSARTPKERHVGAQHPQTMCPSAKHQGCLWLIHLKSPQVLWCQKILCSYSLAVLSKTTAQTSKGEPGPSAHSLIPALLFVLPPSLDREPRAPEGFSMLLWTGGSIKSMSGSGEANGSHFRTTDRMALSEVRKQETSNHVILYVHDPISILWVVLEHVFFLSGSLALHQRRLDVAFTLHFSIELVSIRPNPSNQPQTPSQKVGRSVDPFG